MKYISGRGPTDGEGLCPTARPRSHGSQEDPRSPCQTAGGNKELTVCRRLLGRHQQRKDRQRPPSTTAPHRAVADHLRVPSTDQASAFARDLNEVPGRQAIGMNRYASQFFRGHRLPGSPSPLDGLRHRWDCPSSSPSCSRS